MSCRHLSWWKLTFIIKFKCITLKPGVLKNSQLWIWEPVLIDATQWLCLMEQIRAWSRRNINMQRSDYHRERQSGRHQGWCRSPDCTLQLFSSLPLGFINQNLGESFSLCLVLCSVLPMLWYFYLLENYHEVIHGATKKPRERSSFAVDSQGHAIISCDCNCLSIITE